MIFLFWYYDDYAAIGDKLQSRYMGMIVVIKTRVKSARL